MKILFCMKGWFWTYIKFYSLFYGDEFTLYVQNDLIHFNEQVDLSLSSKCHIGYVDDFECKIFPMIVNNLLLSLPQNIINSYVPR